MKISEAYPSKWLAACDCEDENLTLTIAEVDMEDMKSPGGATDRKMRFGFREDVKDMIVNKTNANTVAKIYGDDTDDWIGKRITIFATDVEYQGKVTRGIRVSSKAPTKAVKGGAGTPADPPKPATAAGIVENDDDDDQIPF
jgi:hypothetical protein